MVMVSSQHPLPGASTPLNTLPTSRACQSVQHAHLLPSCSLLWTRGVWHAIVGTALLFLLLLIWVLKAFWILHHQLHSTQHVRTLQQRYQPSVRSLKHMLTLAYIHRVCSQEAVMQGESRRIHSTVIEAMPHE